MYVDEFRALYGKMVIVPFGVKSLKKHDKLLSQQPLTTHGSSGWGFRSSTLILNGMLVGPILYRLHAGDLPCCEFPGAVAQGKEWLCYRAGRQCPSYVW